MYVIRNEITTIDRYIFLQELLFVISETVLYFYSLYEFLNFLLSCIYTVKNREIKYVYRWFRKRRKKISIYPLQGLKTSDNTSHKFTISIQLVRISPLTVCIRKATNYWP